MPKRIKIGVNRSGHDAVRGPIDATDARLTRPLIQPTLE